MLRVRERAEDKAAPTVPDDIAKAPEKKGVFVIGSGESDFTLYYAMDPQDVFLPRLGPDTWIDSGVDGRR